MSAVHDGVSPILSKVKPNPLNDHQLELTWPVFLALRRWAQEVADAEGAPVYLVGSVLTQDRPRDLDISVIFPLAEFERRYGPAPSPDTPEMTALWGRLQQAWLPYYEAGNDAIKWKTRLDFRFCPDSWWPDKDRLLLATPSGRAEKGA